MYLFILLAVVGIVFCSVGFVMLARSHRDKGEGGVLRSSYWFAAAAVVVLIGAISFVTI